MSYRLEDLAAARAAVEAPSPGPYMDWEDFNIREGSTVGFKAVGGKTFFATVSKVEHNKETGEVVITADRHPFDLKYTTVD